MTENSALDKEAFERGNECLSNGSSDPDDPTTFIKRICSLNPNVPRLAMSCEMWINQEGIVTDYNIFQSIIQTSARMTYQAVNQIIEDNDPETSKEYAKLVPMFHDMAALHHVLETMRIKRGAVSLKTAKRKSWSMEKDTRKKSFCENVASAND